MLRRTVHLFSFVLLGAVISATLMPALAQDIEEGKDYRLVLTNGREVVGKVTELRDAYKVKEGNGIVATYKKSQVRALIPVEAESFDESDLRRKITDAEIDEILGSESVEDLYVWDYIQEVDLLEPLHFDQESLQEMLKFAGKEAKWLDTPHFVCVYTSDAAPARKLVSRLEIVYRWNVAFMRMYNIPAQRPERKFELFYFGTYDEFVKYATLCGHMAEGAAGFYMRTNNRCAFFDNTTYPPVAALLARASSADTPLEERRRLKNQAERWANFFNLGVVQHEATHAIQFNVGIFPKGAPTGKWMTEGLCVQFEVPPTQEGGSFGSLNYSRLDEFHQMYMAGPEGEERVTVPWEFVKNLVLAPGSGIHDYVMGWALNFYLRKEFKEKYGEWMRLLAAREEAWSFGIDQATELADFERAFGKLDEEFVQKFFAWVEAIPLKRSAIVEYPDGP